MYCKFCEKDVQEEPICATCGRTPVGKMGWWSRCSPVLVWPFSTWLLGFGVYRLIIAFQPSIAPRLMRGLVVMVLIILAKGIWATYRRHSFHALVQARRTPTAMDGDTVQVVSDLAGTVKSAETGGSQEIILDRVT